LEYYLEFTVHASVVCKSLDMRPHLSDLLRGA